MTRLRISLAVLLVALPCAAAWSGDQKGWALGTGGILTQMGYERHDVLYGNAPSAAAEWEARSLLASWWEVHTKAELLSTIHSLLSAEGDRVLIVWNYSRAVRVARWGYGATLLSEDEAWDIIVPAAQRLQMMAGSWQELGLDYLNGRTRWYTREDVSRRWAENAYRVLLTNPESPWRKYPWNLDLGNGQHVPDSSIKIAWIEIAAHPAGLMCVRLQIPDHPGQDEYDSAIAEAVGCRPQTSKERRDGPDLIVDTECVRSGTTRGAQVVADLHLEPIARQLRREGVTQLFSYIENIPRGDSDLFPVAYDSWTEKGWHYHLGYHSLARPLPDVTLVYGIPPRQVRSFFVAAGLFVVLSLLGAFTLRRTGWETHFPTLFWAAWIVVTVSFHGLAIAGFNSGDEGTGADIQTLAWYGTLALLLRAGSEFMLLTPELRAAVSRRRAVEICWWRSMTEIPFAIVLVLLCNPQNPLDVPTLIVMLAMGVATTFVAWHWLRLKLGEKGGSVQEGELYDAVFEAARRMRAPLRRLYIQPENLGPRVAPVVGSKGNLMIPERLLLAANRREINGVVDYELMLIKSRHVNAIWATVIPMAAVLCWRAYLYQTSATENFALIREAGIMLSALGAFQKSLGKVQSGAEKAFLAAGGDAEGWIAGLARIARLAGEKLSLGRFEGIAKRCGIAQERVPSLMEVGFPETGRYKVPNFPRDKLEMLT
ncbi:MAG TPA: DUF1266 domain-containing protein [Bryobacteraceae bacterium]|nr:DUF1266 domain-containing protein [Bryobacteraceae bacterium]